MQTISVLQNTDSEYLGLMEDHLEGRNIRFRYIRPAHDSNWVRNMELPKDGLIVLGAAPYGTVSAPVLPMLERRIEIIQSCLAEKLPVVAFGTGAQLLSLAAGSSVKKTALNLTVGTAYRKVDDALNGYLPEAYPVVTWMRDYPEIPSKATVLSCMEDGSPALFQLSENCLGFLGHPGLKSAMIEDSIVQAPALDFGDPGMLEQVRHNQAAIEQSLISMMAGIIQITGWMR